MNVDQIKDNLGQWRKGHSSVPTFFDNLRSFRQWAAQQPERPSNEIFAQWLTYIVDKLATNHSELAEMIRLRFVQNEKTDVIALRLNISSSKYHRNQKQALAELACLITQEEKLAQEVQHTQLYRRFDMSSHSLLFGRDDEIVELLAYITDSTGPSVICIEGMGGLGKTTLLDAVARKAIEQDLFADIGWVSARTHQFDLHQQLEKVHEPFNTTQDMVEQLARQLLGDDAVAVPFNFDDTVIRLQQRFKTMSHLIVFDNLDTLADPSLLLNVLGQWSNTSSQAKFLLSNRVQSSRGVFSYTISELAETHALDLIRHKAKEANMAEISQADNGVLAPIYTAVGGNPLALLLVVGQLQYLGLSQTLDSLRGAHGRSIEELYTHIYRQAWQRLDFEARKVWMATIFVPSSGIDFEHLVQTSKFDSGVVQDALQLLVRWHLVNHHRDQNMDESVYSIHSLTMTFLEGEVNKWFAQEQSA